MKRFLTRDRAFVLLTFALVYLTIEGLSWLAYFFVHEQAFSLERVKKRREFALYAGSSAARLQPKETATHSYCMDSDSLLHPYFGWGNPPGLSFLEKAAPEQSDPDAFVVAITGGSFAHYLFRDSQETLRSAIQQAPILRGKNVRLILMGNACWKQPQQLFAIQYYLLLGGKLDAIVALDGYNELDEAWENENGGVFFAYPWMWRTITARTHAPDTLRRYGEIAVWLGARRSLARAASFLPPSVTGWLLWGVADKLLDHKVTRLWHAARREENRISSQLPFFRRGPRVTAKTRVEILKRARDLWRESSSFLGHLAQRKGIAYFHFLQPNQYVRDSKTFSAKENRIFGTARDAGSNRENIAMGYPLLVGAGRELAAEGINFFNLTEIFKGVKETVYLDNCCHVNLLGQQIVAEEIGRQVGNTLAGSQTIVDRRR